MPNRGEALCKQLWKTALPLLAERVGPVTYDGFLRNVKALSYDGETFVLEVPNQFAKAWLEEHHSGVIGAALAELLQRDEPVRLDLRVSDRQPEPTFEQFVVADCNRFAHAAAVQVAKSPGKSYNPLFIHSKVGLGKTHLMQAIGHMVCKLYPSARVVYISAEDFVNELITSIRDNRTEAFRRKYRTVDVWLVDDIQFIAAIEGPVSEEAFFHTFNTLYQNDKQVVIASDCPPRHLQLINERLRSRLEMGIVADLRHPDVETRIAILEKKVQTEEVSIPREILELIAKEVESNIRVLEGALLNSTG